MEINIFKDPKNILCHRPLDELRRSATSTFVGSPNLFWGTAGQRRERSSATLPLTAIWLKPKLCSRTSFEGVSTSGLCRPEVRYSTALLNRGPKVLGEASSSELRLYNKCINLLTKDGKKTIAFSLFREALTLINKKTKNRQAGASIADLRSAKLSPTSFAIGGPSGKAPPKGPSSFARRPPTKSGGLCGPQVFGSEARLQPKTEGRETKSSLPIGANFVFLQSIENVKPIFEVKKVRIAGNTLLVPALIPFHRQENIALRWIIEAAHERKKKNANLLFEECLALEIIEASKHQGSAKQKRNELHKIAEANRAFSHYKWW